MFMAAQRGGSSRKVLCSLHQRATRGSTCYCCSPSRMYAALADNEDGIKVGFIGLGNMGSRMAANLMHAGFSVSVYDQSPKTMHLLQDNGAETAASAAELASLPGLRALVTMLPSSKAVKDVYIGSEGILAAAKEAGGVQPSLLIDCSTIDPPTAQQVCAAVQATKLHKDSIPFEGCRASAPSMLDAPVSGGITGASAATLSFMVGGDPAAFKAAEPILKAMGKHMLYCGKSGLGQTAKVCNNLAVGIQMASIAEALSLGARMGLDPTALSAIFNVSSARCWSSEAYNPAPGVAEGTPASRGYEGGFASRLMVKDLGLAKAAAGHVSMHLPMGEAALQLYEQVAKEQPDLDFGAIYEYAYSQLPMSVAQQG